METKDRQKILWIAVVAGLGLLLANSVIINPLVKSWHDRGAEVAALEKKVTDGRNLIKRKSAYEARWQGMQTNTLPNDQSAAGSALLKSMDRWRQNSGISIDQISPQWKTEEDPDSKNVITTLECRTDASGNMRSMLQFLWDVEKDPLGLKVEDIVLSARDNNGQQLALGLQLSGLVLGPPPEQAQQASQP